MIVRRIFREYAAGRSARNIASKLNADGIAGPSGQAWGASTIAGNAARGTGILNNELYIGRLVWNRLRYLEDPSTGKRISRPNDPSDVIIKEVPELRVVDDDLWQLAKQRQAKMVIGPQAKTAGEDGSWNRRRPRYLLSGLMRCGVCGGGFSKVGASHFGCSQARNNGTRANRLTIRQEHVESTVLGALQHRLMDPALYAAFVTEFTAEHNRLQAGRQGVRRLLEAELQGARAKIARIVKAVEDGFYDPAMKQRMHDLRSRHVKLERQLTLAEAPAPLLHPGLADIYRVRVASPQQALTVDDGEEIREAIRALVEAIVLVPIEGKLAIEVEGDLAAMLRRSLPATGPGRVGCWIGKLSWLRGEDLNL